MENGRIINQYKIISAIGKGGMGEVFLAEDTKLDRKVALKILPSEFAEDKDRMSRFVREAKSASALNHPNIITIYEIGESDGTHFIATEFIDGKTLGEYAKANPLSYRTALEIALQVASALDEAHLAGIVHRDIKPDNVMIRANGLVKILDFGIAKVSASSTSASDSSEDATAIKSPTMPGMIIGTANYMSPEQAKGKEVDARTDIFSFGVVLYEMIAGQLPFEGENALEMIGAILHKEAKPLGPDVPTEISKLINKCLRKDRDERYQTIKDVGNDLREVKQELELKNLMERTASPDAQEPKTQMIQPTTVDETRIQTASSAEYLVSQVKEHKKGVLLGLALLVLVIAGVAFGIYKFAFKKDTTAPSFESMKVTKLTDTGKAGSAAISPDGKYVAHLKQDAGQQSIWVRHIATGSNVQIIPPTVLDYGRMTFSPDGSYIYFIRRAIGATNYELFQIPVLGGEPKKLNSHVNSPVTFSPDGKRIAFVRTQQDERIMVIANADGTGEQPLASTKKPDRFKESGPAWSPDGKVIATSFVNKEGSGERYDSVVEVSVADGTVKPIGSQQWRDVSRVVWLANGSGLLTSSFEWGEQPNDIYQISYPGGEAQKVTNDVNTYFDLSITADSDSIVTVQEERIVNIWVAPDGTAGSLRQLTRGANKYEGQGGVRWTPDGKILFGARQVFQIMNGDGSDQRPLKEKSRNPAFSPDGRYIVYTSTSKPGTSEIWRMDINGANPKQLADKGSNPDISPDGRWVVYNANAADVQGSRVWKVSIDGGESVQLTDYLSGMPAVSPDGKTIAALYSVEENSPFKIAIIPFEGGPPTKTLDLPRGFNTVQLRFANRTVLRWLPDGRSLAYIATIDGVSNIWSMPIDGGAPKQLTNFTTDQIAWFDLSRDGKPTLFSRGSVYKDVVLISGFRK